MRDNEDIQTCISELEEIYSAMREEDPTIDQALAFASRAVKVYRKFRKQMADTPFDVVVLEPGAKGVFEEKPFDWEAVSGG